MPSTDQLISVVGFTMIAIFALGSFKKKPKARVVDTQSLDEAIRLMEWLGFSKQESMSRIMPIFTAFPDSSVEKLVNEGLRNDRHN